MASVEAEARVKHAIDYWGQHLIQPNKLPTEKLERLLRGIAYCISARFPVQDDEDCRDLTPSQLSSFYRLVGGNYDPLFCDMPSQSLAIIYKSLGCSHSLQPSNPKDGHCAPCIPALKSRGFVKWQTIQLLLGPQEHAPFIQNALDEFNVVDPVDGKPFIKLLPLEVFPSQPDREMVEWHNTVGERLRWEAQEAADQAGDSRPSTAEDDTASINGAAHYISNNRQKLHREDKHKDEKPKEDKPTLIKQITGAPAKVFSPGNVIGRAARNFIDPNLWNPGRRSVSERPAPPRDSWAKKEERRDNDYNKDARRDYYARPGSRPQSSQSPRWSGDRDRGRGGNESGHHTQGQHERPDSGSRRDGRWRSTSSSRSNSPPHRTSRQRSVSHDSPQTRRSYFGPSGHRSGDEQQQQQQQQQQPPRRPYDSERRESYSSSASRAKQNDMHGASGTHRRNGSNSSNGPDFGPPGSRGSPQPQWAGHTSAPRVVHTAPPSQTQQSRQHGSSDHPYSSYPSQQQQTQQQQPPSNSGPPQRPMPMSRNGSLGNIHNIDMQRSQSHQQPPSVTSNNAGARRADSLRQNRPSKPVNGGDFDAADNSKRHTIDHRWQPKWEDQYRPSPGAAGDVHLGVPRPNDASLQRRRSAPSQGSNPRVSPSMTPERRSSGFEVRTPGGTVGMTDYFGVDAADTDLSGGAGGIPQTQVNGVGGRRYPSETPWD